LLAPPPKSPNHSHFIASILCHPIKHPHLLLQLQRKDPDTRHAFPQFDLVCRRSGRLSRKDLERNPHLTTIHNGRRPREVAIQQSETNERVAVIKYVDALSTAHKRRLEIAPDDNSVIAVISWTSRTIVREWTVHRYEAKRKGNKIVGYEFRMRSDRDGKENVSVRWTRKVLSIARPRSMSSRHRRSDSVSSSEGPQRRHTFAATPTKPVAPPSDPKWEFSSLNCRRIMASMTSQKLHIHSVSSAGTSLSSPSSSDFDEDFHGGDRELTTGRIMEFLTVSGLFVGLEEDFASKLRKEFLSAGKLRVRASTEFDDTPAPSEVPVIRSPKKVRPALAPVQSVESSYEQQSQVEEYHVPEPEVHVDVVPRTSISSKAPTTVPEAANYASRGWGYMSACVTKLMSLAV
jgi:hypothetical protein